MTLELLEIMESPTKTVGIFLDKLCIELSPPCSTDFRSLAVLHQCHNFKPNQLIKYLYFLNNKQIPKSYEILRCHPETTLSEIHFFFQRIECFPRQYFFLQVDILSSKVQEVCAAGTIVFVLAKSNFCQLKCRQLQ